MFIFNGVLIKFFSTNNFKYIPELCVVIVSTVSKPTEILAGTAL